eukprot:gb/GECG01006604.1/.p1 GENE.gb/GECG01006604.1/~~gb/GECG01006604.1/.p1  ORF type:complete len:383 (+),score=49.65 gb/GECG01006604.1/:1-1149(+)
MPPRNYKPDIPKAPCLFSLTDSWEQSEKAKRTTLMKILIFPRLCKKSWSPWERDLASIFIAEKHRKSGEWGQSSKLLERLSSERYYQAAVLASLLYQKMRCEKVSAEQGEQLLKQVMQQTETAYANGQTSSSQLQEVLRVGIAVYLDWESYSRVDDLCEQLGTLSAQSGNDFNGAFAEASRFTAHVRNPSKSVGDLETLLNKFQHSCSRNVKSTIPPSPDAAAIVTETLPWGRDSGTRNRDSRISKPEIGAPTKGGGVVEPQKKVGKNYKTEAARERRRRQRERQRERHIQKLKAARVSANVPLPAPDPERWIPRLDRSYNRARRKKKAKKYENKGGAQGAGGSEDAKIAASLDARAQSEQPAKEAASGKKSGKRRKKGGRR